MVKCGTLCALIFMLFIHGSEPPKYGNVCSASEPPKWFSFCSAGEPEIIDSRESGTGSINHVGFRVAHSWLIHVNSNSSDIDINLRNFVLDNHFLVIKDEATTPDTSSNGMIQFISGESEKPLKFKIPIARSFYMEICPETASVSGEVNFDSGKFILDYVRKDPDFDDEPIPDDDPEIEKKRESYEVQFKGQPTDKFECPDFRQQFKEAVKQIAEEYCRSNKIFFDEQIPASEMVSIYAIHECPFEWPERGICSSILHSVAVSDKFHLMGRRFAKYMLTSSHLEDMWSRFNGSQLNSLDLAIYQLPQKEVFIGWWFLTIVVPVIIFISVVFFVWRLYTYVKKDWDLSTSETTLPVATEKRKKSKLRPNEFQSMPSFIKDQKEAKDSGGRRNGEGGDSPPEERNYYAALLLPRFRLPEENQQEYL